MRDGVAFLSSMCNFFAAITNESGKGERLLWNLPLQFTMQPKVKPTMYGV